jgi:CrcB protein
MLPDAGTDRTGGAQTMPYLLAALGGALGALARWRIAEAVPASSGGWPWATLLVNLSGCVLIGVLLAVVLHSFPTSRWIRPFFAVGVLGGYTTYSTFAVEVVRMVDAGSGPTAAAYVLASVVGGAACVFAGLLVTRAVLHLTESVLAELEAGEDQT